MHHRRAMYLDLVSEGDPSAHVYRIPLSIDRAQVFLDRPPIHLRLERVYDNPVLDIGIITDKEGLPLVAANRRHRGHQYVLPEDDPPDDRG